ncbi:hypothetical protein BJ138DRAFT_1143230 [Hygrophoropsis aurantiaca]|uniref:Uncharacterized protein n=1 Tax=Hygrophoropsis aurantiaca TaxID=72124 RepID=A0ACB8AP50_9AGAM|nr:hypothetical protein BJ138DRAFT_1143230 [Hygrophoropsis aurantiaca]
MLLTFATLTLAGLAWLAFKPSNSSFDLLSMLNGASTMDAAYEAYYESLVRLPVHYLSIPASTLPEVLCCLLFTCNLSKYSAQGSPSASSTRTATLSLRLTGAICPEMALGHMCSPFLCRNLSASHVAAFLVVSVWLRRDTKH